MSKNKTNHSAYSSGNNNSGNKAGNKTGNNNGSHSKGGSGNFNKNNGSGKNAGNSSAKNNGNRDNNGNRGNHGNNGNYGNNSANKPYNNSKPAPEKEKATPVTPEEADDIRVTIQLEDGSDAECAILTILQVGDRDYIALLPMDENDEPNEDGMVYLYRYEEDQDGIPSLDNILDDEEYEAVYDAFDEWQDDQMFDEM